jgi:hypothetical protein
MGQKNPAAKAGAGRNRELVKEQICSRKQPGKPSPAIQLKPVRDSMDKKREKGI